MSNRLRQGWPYLFVVVAPLALFAPFLTGAQVLYWGTPLLQFVPWRRFMVEAIRAGHLPLWNPWVGNGAPFIANYQSGVFYPPNWLSFLLPVELSLSWILVLHLMWAGAGMVTLARALGLRPLGQALAGLAFGLSQYIVARPAFFSTCAALAWLPWIIWAGERVVNPNLQLSTPKGALRAVLWLVLFSALQLLAGHAQMTWYTLVLLGTWVLWRAVTAPVENRRGLCVRVALVAGALMWAALLAAVQLLPTAEYLRESPRSDSVAFESAMTFSFSPWRLLSFLAPDILGNPARGRFYGYGAYWEDAVYIGVLPFMLGLGYLIAGRSRGLSLSRFFFALLITVSVILALGQNTPVLPFLYQHVPTFNLFQGPTRWIVWTLFALALLGGAGADEWRMPQGRALYWTRLGAAGAVSIIVTSVAALLLLSPESPIGQQLATVAQAALVMGLGLFGVALLSLLKPSAPSLRWELAVAAFLAVDLIYANAGLNPGAPADLYRTPSANTPALTRVLEGHRLFQFSEDEARLKYDTYLSFLNFGPPELARAARADKLPNSGMLDGIATANNFDPLMPARYAGFMEVVSQTRSAQLLQLMDVQVIASSAPLDTEKVAEGAQVSFYRLPATARRVWVVYTARTVANAAAARAALAELTFDPATHVLLEADDAGTLPNSAFSLDSSLTLNPNLVTIPVNLERPGWVVLADTHYPGWSVFVDGQPARLWHGDYAFRAVAVEAGSHILTFQYDPPSFRLGFALTAIGIIAWCALAIVGLRPGR